MAVYIDNFNAPYGRMKMCHMIADTTEELLEMVDGYNTPEPFRNILIYRLAKKPLQSNMAQ